MMCETIEWYRKIISGTFWCPSRSNTVDMAARTAEMKIVLAQTVSQVRTSHSSETSTKITENMERGGRGWVRKVLERGRVAESWQCSIAGAWAFCLCALQHCPIKQRFSGFHSNSPFSLLSISLPPPVPGLSHFSLSFQPGHYLYPWNIPHSLPNCFSDCCNSSTCLPASSLLPSTKKWLHTVLPLMYGILGSELWAVQPGCHRSPFSLALASLCPHRRDRCDLGGYARVLKHVPEKLV